MTTPPHPSRVVTLVLVTSQGDLIGRLEPFPVESPWWQEAEPVVRGARRVHGVGVTLLRLLDAQGPFPGGEVTYLAEVSGPADAEPWDGRLDDHPLRLPYARPGGPAADVAWAASRLRERGIPTIGAPEQVRTWNVSSLWRLPAQTETAWLKVVPPFFAHEGAMLEMLAGGPVPSLIAHEGPRMLLHEIVGDDLYEATDHQLRTMVSQLVAIQVAWSARIDELLAVGLPDWRGPALAEAIASVVERTADELTLGERSTLARFVEGLDERMSSVAACGLPDTLVHGDFHPGNHRGVGDEVTLLDWGDSGVGHPLLDEAAFVQRLEAATRDAVRDHWHREWRAAVPGCDSERAAELLEPVAAARQAVIYRKFLDNIEPSEHPYHAGDTETWLRRTASVVAAAPKLE